MQRNRRGGWLAVPVPVSVLVSVLVSVPAWLGHAAPLAASEPPCHAGGLARFVGDWTARGAYRIDPDAAEEPVRCRVAFAAAADAPGRIEASGLCVTTASKSRVGGWLACDGADYLGPFVTLEDEPVPTFLRDASTGDEIVLSMQAPHPETGEVERYRLRIGWQTPDAMTVRLTRGTWTAMTLRYARAAP